MCFTAICFLFLLEIRRVNCKGVAGIGSGGSNSVCVECAGNYTIEEMEVAIIVVGSIMTLFLVILACQCYSRIMWECCEDPQVVTTMKHMPPPAYTKGWHSGMMA